MLSEKVARKAKEKAPKAIGAKQATRQQTLGQIVEEEARALAKQLAKGRKAKEVNHALQARFREGAMAASLDENATNVEAQITSRKIDELPKPKSESTRKSKEDSEHKNCK